eukprot:11956-Heterococcus_DN1.PRE.2
MQIGAAAGIIAVGLLMYKHSAALLVCALKTSSRHAISCRLSYECCFLLRETYTRMSEHAKLTDISLCGLHSLLLAAAPHSQVAVRRLFKAGESAHRDSKSSKSCSSVPPTSVAAAIVTPLASGMHIVNYIPFACAATTVTTTATVEANALDTSKISTASAAAAIEHSAQLSHYAVVIAEVVDSGYVSDVSDDDVYEAQFDRYDSVFASSVYNMSTSDKQHTDSNRLVCEHWFTVLAGQQCTQQQ